MNNSIQVGDIVCRVSYGGDLYFRVLDIKNSNGMAYLTGLNFRILADAPLSDLEAVSKESIQYFKQSFLKETDEKLMAVLSQRNGDDAETNHLTRTLEAADKEGDAEKKPNNESLISIPGKVLHLDGDGQFLKMCLNYYEKLGVPAVGEMVAEKKQPEVIVELLKKHMPDIVVITGHDSLSGTDKQSLASYRTSGYFVDAVKAARSHQASKDSLVIFAGACQSHFEALLEAGANFASSPNRIMIHALDPVLLAHKLSYSSFENVLDCQDVVADTITGLNGIGGFQTRGTYRYGTPVTTNGSNGKK